MFRIHELHHHVLSSWAVLHGRLPSVLCFDHHTDILPAFSSAGTYPSDAGADLEKDIKRLAHDEHFDYALRYGMIADAVIISHTSAVTPPPSGLEVVCTYDFTNDEVLNSERFRQTADMAIEDEFLLPLERFFPKDNYILDIDCDYFKTFRSLEPESCSIFRKLLCNAEMVTFSCEDDWVRILTFENPAVFTPQYIIDKIIKMQTS